VITESLASSIMPSKAILQLICNLFYAIFDFQAMKKLGKWCKEYKDDIIILVCDNAPWHGAESMIVPENIIILN